jgi:hypothetical protein
MKLPGFTAETSIYQSGAHYALAAGSAEAANGQQVIPQLCIGSFNKTFRVGPVSLTVSGCAIPPKACVKLCAFSACKSFCVP